MMDKRDMGFGEPAQAFAGRLCGVVFLGIGRERGACRQGVSWFGGLPSIAQGRSELRQLQAVRLPERLQVGVG
jgi:hypothetical protein